MTWRYIATRLNGDGTESVIDPECPLTGVTITYHRNAPFEISGHINPERRNLEDAAGISLIEKWSTAFYFEKDDEIRAGGILVDDPVTGPDMQLDIMGMAGYPNTQPYTEANTWPANPPETDLDPDIDAEEPSNSVTVAPTQTSTLVYNKKTKTYTAVAYFGVQQPAAMVSPIPVQWASATAAPGNTDYPVDGMEPMFAIREIWRHLQSQERGNLGVQIDPMNTGRLIGKLVAQGEFDTVNGPLAFEYEPLLLRWFETYDMGDVINKLCENLPMDFREEHTWNEDHTAITHFIRFGYPKLGSRRSDVIFTIGDNVDPVGIEAPIEEYASHVVGLGAGEGSAMLRADAIRSDEIHIRRAVVYEDKSANTAAAIATSARNELMNRLGLDQVTAIKVKPSQVDALSGIMPGDEVLLVGEQEHRDVDMWVRIESKTVTCDTDALEFEVTRADMLA